MSDDFAPLVGFGDPDDTDAFAHFHCEKDDQGEYGDWDQELTVSTRQIAGSSAFDTFVGGFGPARLTLAVWFDTRDDYRRLLRTYGTVATLVLLAGFTSHEGPIRTHLGRDYEQYRDTLLVGIANVAHEVDGAVRCEVTFQRGYDPQTGQGVAS